MLGHDQKGHDHSSFSDDSLRAIDGHDDTQNQELGRTQDQSFEEEGVEGVSNFLDELYEEDDEEEGRYSPASSNTEAAISGGESESRSSSITPDSDDGISLGGVTVAGAEDEVDEEEHSDWLEEGDGSFFGNNNDPHAAGEDVLDMLFGDDGEDGVDLLNNSAETENIEGAEADGAALDVTGITVADAEDDVDDEGDDILDFLGFLDEEDHDLDAESLGDGEHIAGEVPADPNFLDADGEEIAPIAMAHVSAAEGYWGDEEEEAEAAAVADAADDWLAEGDGSFFGNNNDPHAAGDDVLDMLFGDDGENEDYIEQDAILANQLESFENNPIPLIAAMMVTGLLQMDCTF